MRISAFLACPLAALALSACGGSSDEGSGDASGADYEQTFGAGDGTATVSTGGDITVDLPLGFETYPDAKVVSSMKINNPGVRGNTVFMETSDSVQDVTNYYRAMAEAQGIEINMETASADTMLLAGRNEGEAGFNMMATTNDEGQTTVQLTVSEMPADVE